MKKRHIIFFTKYTRAGASSRYRTFQYLPALHAAGIECMVSPLFDDAYLAYKYSKGRASLWHVLIAFVRRVFSVLTVSSGATVVIEYELLPFFPALLERWLTWRGCRLVVDYDDALFHQYDQHTNRWVRRLLGSKIANVIRLSDMVVAGNVYLASYARCAGARRVELIPTVIDLMRYPAMPAKEDSALITIGWIGSPSTARYLRDIALALAEVFKGGSARVRLIGSGPVDLPGVPVEVMPWREEAEVVEIRRFDVGIMPLPDEPWARGKCGFKLIQYMACGLPVVASPVGVNSEIVENGVNGFLASSTNEWVSVLHKLAVDRDLRIKMGIAGRKKVEEQYCLQVTAPKMVALLQSVVNRVS